MADAPENSSDDGARLSSRMRPHSLLWRMMARLGIDPTGRWRRGFEGMIGRAAARCAACPSTDECVAWLARSAPGEWPPGFCPNHRTLEACRIMAPDAARNAAPEPEPSLPDMLGDPIVRQVMAADRVDRDTLQQAMENAPTPAATDTVKPTRP